MVTDAEYYRFRLAEELSAAVNSRSAAAERCHRELAAAYSKKVADLRRRDGSVAVELAA